MMLAPAIIHSGPTLGRSFQDLPSNMGVILATGEALHPLSTKLICTLGPSSRDVDTISKLLKSGMKVARFDFTWGTPEYHQQTLENLKEAQDQTNLHCAICLETCGREILVLNREDSAIQLKQGDVITLSCDRSANACQSLLPISTLTSFDGLVPGTAVFVGQYLFTGSETSSAYLTLQSVDAGGKTCKCLCNNTCSLPPGLHLTVTIAGLSVPGPPLSPEDEISLSTWGQQNQVDFISLAFTRSAEDIDVCRSFLKSCGLESAKIIAKVECLEGLTAHKKIIDVADAVIFSRGNFGTSLPPEKVFLAQKLLIRVCNLAGKPIFITRIVDSMTEAPRPTRAEATDVANLILDGADGVLLGSETFRGNYPEATVQTVSAICSQAEEYFSSGAFYTMTMESMQGWNSVTPNISKPEAIASSAVRIADKTDAKLIIVFTVTGRTAALLSKYKPRQPILTLVCSTSSSATYSEAKLCPAKMSMVRSISEASLVKSNKLTSTVLRQCLLYRGVIPVLATPELTDSAELLEYGLMVAKGMGLVTSGDRVIVSQCPRKGGNEVWDEAGVVSALQVV